MAEAGIAFLLHDIASVSQKELLTAEIAKDGRKDRREKSYDHTLNVFLSRT